MDGTWFWSRDNQCTIALWVISFDFVLFLFFFRKKNILSKTDIQYWSGGTKLFAVPKYEKTLLQVCKRADIKLIFFEKLLEIDAVNKRAKFIGFGEANKETET